MSSIAQNANRRAAAFPRPSSAVSPRRPPDDSFPPSVREELRRGRLIGARQGRRSAQTASRTTFMASDRPRIIMANRLDHFQAPSSPSVRFSSPVVSALRRTRCISFALRLSGDASSWHRDEAFDASVFLALEYMLLGSASCLYILFDGGCLRGNRRYFIVPKYNK